MSFRDVVVLLPGITGSVLARGGKEVWSPSAGSIWRALTSVGHSVTGLELAADGDPGDVTASRLIPDVTIVPGLIKIDGYTRIEQYLVSELSLTPGKNYFPFPYDWRLDNRINAKRLDSAARTWLRAWQASSGASDARLILIGHSMGGLISRYFLEKLGGWQHTRSLFTLGTPHRGSLNAVDFLVHGMKKGVGPFGVDLSPLLRSCPSVYQLLPIYPCVETGAGPLSRVADAAQAGQLPNVEATRARDARAFHSEIEDAQQANALDTKYVESGYRVIPLVGIEQPTRQSARALDGVVEMLRSYQGKDDGGDGTVPRVSATPLELSEADREVYAAEMHGALQNSAGVLANIRGVITKPDIDLKRFRAELPTTLTLDMDDVVPANEPLTVRVRPGEGNPTIMVEVTNVATGEMFTEPLRRSREPGWQEATLGVPPGTWRVTARAAGASSVSDLAVVVTP